MTLEEKIEGVLLKRCRTTLQGHMLRIASTVARKLDVELNNNSEEIWLIGKTGQLRLVVSGENSELVVVIFRRNNDRGSYQFEGVGRIENGDITKDSLETEILRCTEELVYAGE